jgi:hypothetical protein
MTSTALNEHSLVNPLVNNYEGNLWRIHSIVQRLNCIFELGDFLFDDLISHLLTHSISIDDDLGR